jgi:hypothetical protein
MTPRSPQSITQQSRPSHVCHSSRQSLQADRIGRFDFWLARSDDKNGSKVNAQGSVLLPLRSDRVTGGFLPKVAVRRSLTACVCLLYPCKVRESQFLFQAPARVKTQSSRGNEG